MLRNNLVHNISEAASSYIRIGVININFKRELARIKVQSKYAQQNREIKLTSSGKLSLSIEITTNL